MTNQEWLKKFFEKPVEEIVKICEDENNDITICAFIPKRLGGCWTRSCEECERAWLTAEHEEVIE